MFKLFRKPMIWFVSDIHAGHSKVIEYCNRPYKDVETMHKAIIKIWNKTVNNHDTIYVLGDFSLNPKWVDQIVPKLKGNKILISGNHDNTFVYKNTVLKDKLKSFERYKKAGFKEIHQQLELTLKNGQKVLLSHLPYWTGQLDLRYQNERPIDNGLPLIHGHLHAKYRKSGKMIDVAFDGDLKLWSEKEVIDLLNDPRDHIDSGISDFYRKRGKL